MVEDWNSESIENIKENAGEKVKMIQPCNGERGGICRKGSVEIEGRRRRGRIRRR